MATIVRLVESSSFSVFSLDPYFMCVLALYVFLHVVILFYRRDAALIK